MESNSHAWEEKEEGRPGARGWQIDFEDSTAEAVAAVERERETISISSRGLLIISEG